MARRVALLVATYRYQDVGLRQLTAPGQDAEALAAVLRHPEIAGFEVTILVNEPHHVVGDAIGEFYHDCRREDLTLLYFTGHGLKDDQGRLYLAMTDTKRDRLLFSGLSAQQIDEAMESCRSRQKILVLDCCYSGAFPVGRLAKSDAQVNTLEKFQGKGRVVLTASDATQYSFEGEHISGRGTQSVFTRFLVEGLTTGEADLDGDGDISLDELYSYVYDRVVEEMPQQRPKKQENVEGRIVIARNISWTLPSHLRSAIQSPYVGDRLAVLERLAHLHRVGNDLVRAEVINEIRRLIDDENKAVSASAMELMSAFSPVPARPEVGEHARLKANDATARSDQPGSEAGTEQYRKTGAATTRQTRPAESGASTGTAPAQGRHRTAIDFAIRRQLALARQGFDRLSHYLISVLLPKLPTPARTGSDGTRMRRRVLIGLALLSSVVMFFLILASGQYYVQADSNGEVAIFNGFRGDILGVLPLHMRAEGSCRDGVPGCEAVLLSDLQPYARTNVRRGMISNSGVDGAREIIGRLRTNDLLPLCGFVAQPGVDCRMPR